MRVAVIGSGAAAAGTLGALARWAPDSRVTLFDHGDSPEGPLATAARPEARPPDHARDVYARIRREHGFAFPPPKTHFGVAPLKQAVAGWGDVWDNRVWGGLTSFWGGSALPFPDDELRRWPVSAADLAPYYAQVAQQVGVSGDAGALDRYFGEGYVNRPPIALPSVFQDLMAAVNRDGPAADRYDLLAGGSRLAVETREGHAAACFYCGECMTGCSAGAIYAARQDVDRGVAAGQIEQVVRARVWSVAASPLRVTVKRGDGAPEAAGDFDRIYVCAGAFGSAEIVMRSLGLAQGPQVVDGAVFTFPIVNLRSRRAGEHARGYFGLTNLLIGCVPRGDDGRFALIQVYPAMDHLWRYFLPVGAWRAFQGVGRQLRRRFLLGRIFLHGDLSQAYALSLGADGELGVALARPPSALRDVPGLWASVRRRMSRDGFFVPPSPVIRHATSSHYGGSFPLGCGPVGADGSFLPGAYLCSSAAFPTVPAISPTMTIMALAARLTHRSL